jgi:septal ring factor EnvC (AmiA/AmiB activator)
MQIYIKMLLLLWGGICQGCLQAGELSNPGSAMAVDSGAHASNNRAAMELEISRLRRDLAKNKAENKAISDQNSELLSRMKELESRILQLREKALDQSDDVSDSDLQTK